MVIDIIDYKEEQYAELTDAQLLEIRDAQQRKNARILKMYEEMRALRQKAVDNGMLYSRAYGLTLVEVQENCDLDIMRIKEELVFYLQYASRPEDTSSSGYDVDYSLSTTERFHQLKDYYMDAYSDAQVRYEEFTKDKIAKTYLCETYSALLDYFWTLANE